MIQLFFSNQTQKMVNQNKIALKIDKKMNPVDWPIYL